MSKTINILLIGLLTVQLNAQEIHLDFIPERLENVSEEDYHKGKNYLLNTYQAIKDTKTTTYVDYWNVGMAYSYMGLPSDIVLSYFQKAKATNQESFCMVAAYAIQRVNSINEHRLYGILGIGLYDLISDCNISLERRSLESRMMDKEDVVLTGLNEALINQLIQLSHKDQFYRYSHSSYTENWEAQNKLDAEVSTELTKIFETYAYPGKSLVGEKFMNYACLLLEHGSQLQTQEKYFPLVADALKNGEVDKPYVRMLIDRIHWKKTGKQIFGSHAGIPFNNDEIIQNIKEKYAL